MSEPNPGLMTLFAEALELPDPAARAAYLHGACGDAVLRQRVEALLAAHAGAGRFLEPDATDKADNRTHLPTDATAAFELERPPSMEVQTAASHPTPFADALPTGRGAEAAPRTVIAGRYTLAEIIGEGGMGSVYRAEQTEPVKRQVALKLIKSGMDSKAVLARFDAERQALALMDHPNIARVYDGGTTEQGQPFFVMELVHGVPLTDYCDRHRLSVRARLELFVQVCLAVQHAHQKGIIHRDLKPSNVLVTEVDGKPTPKVIDFGVAKATEARLTNMSYADTGAIVGTPAYMSPEQADPSSMDIDTRTDVYALGVMLYELLVGSPPLDARLFRRGALLEMLRMVREVDPPRPSTRLSAAENLPNIAANRGVEPARLARSLRGELDWVVMKALEKDRSRRYDTANGLARDIQRYLADEVVEARPPSAGYRLRKFLKRNTGPVIAVSLLGAALLAGILGTTWGLIEARQQEQEAKYHEGIAREQAGIAKENETKAREQAGIATKNAEDAERKLDNSTFLRAVAAHDSRDFAQTQFLLDEINKNRNWEWHYLRRQSTGAIFTLHGHTSEVWCVAFSPDGTRIVTGSDDPKALVWDARTGTPLLELRGHNELVTGVAFSPDGTRIATCSLDGKAFVWDARKGTPSLKLKRARLTSLAFSPDGTRLVTGNQYRTADVWDARTGALLLQLKGHAHWVMSVAYSPDGKRLVTGSRDAKALVWDAEKGTPLRELKGHTDRVNSVAFSPDGNRVVTGSQDRTARVWDAEKDTPPVELKGHTQPVWSVAFSPDGNRIVTSSQDRTAKVWDARTGTEMLELQGHTGEVWCAAFSPDGTRVVTGSDDRTAKVWDARTGIPRLDLNGGARALDVRFSSDGTRIGSSDQLWDASTGTPLLDHKGRGETFRALAFSPDGTRLVTGCAPPNSGPDETARVWDARTGRELLELKGHKKNVLCVAFSPDGRRVVTGGGYREFGQAKVWDAETGTPQLDLKGLTAVVQCVAFSPDSKRIVTGGGFGESGQAKVWDAETGTPLLDLEGHTGEVRHVSFRPDGTRILTASKTAPLEDGTVKVWDARTGKVLLKLKSHYGVPFSPDGTHIVTVTGGLAGGKSIPGVVSVWDAETGQRKATLKGLTRAVWSVAFSPDGNRIVTGGGQAGFRGPGQPDPPGEALVWDARTGTPLLELKGLPTGVLSVAFSPDGTRIVTGDDRGTVKVWDAQPGPPLLSLRGATGPVAFSPDGTRVVTGGEDRTARVWDARTGASLLELKGDRGETLNVCFSPDGQRVVTSRGVFNVHQQNPPPGEVRLWDTRTGALLLELKDTGPHLLSMAFSPDGTRLVGGRANLMFHGAGLEEEDHGRTRVWDARTGVVLLAPRGAIGPGVFSPDGKRLVTGNREATAKVWDAETGMPLLELKGTLTGLRSVAFSADGTRIVTGSFPPFSSVAPLGHIDERTIPYGKATLRSLDPTAKVWETVWDARTGAELKGEAFPPSLPNDRISPDGRFFAQVKADRVELIPLTPDDKEQAYRLLHTQPNERRYRDSYEAARAAGDDFAARFYLDLLIEFYTAKNQPDEAKKWRAERAKYPPQAQPGGEKK